MPTRARARVLLVPLIAACTALAWSLGVLLSEDPEQPDHLWRPIDTLVEQRLAVTLVALAVAAVSGVAYGRLRARGETPSDEVALPLVMIGIVIGIGYSVVTAPTIGANIGGGLVLIGAPVAVLALATVSIRAALRHRATVRRID